MHSTYHSMCVYFMYNCSDYFGSRSIIDPYNYFTNELENNLAKSGTQISELITRSTAWLDSWNKEYLKSRGIKIPLKKDKKSRGYNNKAGSKSQPELQQLPYCDPIDVIKHFIRTEREKELARLAYIHIHVCTCSTRLHNEIHVYQRFLEIQCTCICTCHLLYIANTCILPLYCINAQQ